MGSFRLCRFNRSIGRRERCDRRGEKSGAAGKEVEPTADEGKASSVDEAPSGSEIGVIGGRPSLVGREKSAGSGGSSTEGRSSTGTLRRSNKVSRLDSTLVSKVGD